MAAYVEIIFDNSDGLIKTLQIYLISGIIIFCIYIYIYIYIGRIPIESDEVVLRRTVGYTLFF